MTRLFTALWPPRRVVSELETALTGGPATGADAARWPPEGWRAIPSRRWHVTLCFHGEADPGVLARRLDSLATGLPAPWLRLAGAVSLGSVTAAVVHPAGPEDAAALAGLVSAAGADRATHRPHVSVARTSRRSDAPPAGGPLHRFRGSWWRPDEVCLVRSELSSGSPRYTVLHRVPLRAVTPDPPPGRPWRCATDSPPGG
jgi:2'-5' RNA ligase